MTPFFRLFCSGPGYPAENCYNGNVYFNDNLVFNGIAPTDPLNHVGRDRVSGSHESGLNMKNKNFLMEYISHNDLTLNGRLEPKTHVSS